MVIVLVIVLFFGAKKIPELARGFGKGIQEFKNATSDIQREIQESTKEVTAVRDVVDVEKQVKNTISKQINPVPQKRGGNTDSVAPKQEDQTQKQEKTEE